MASQILLNRYFLQNIGLSVGVRTSSYIL